MDYTIPIIKKILEENQQMVLATITPEGEPWISPLFYSYTEHFTLFWTSAKVAKHSQNLIENAKTAVTIHNREMHGQPNWDCVFFTGNAYEVSAQEFPQALNNYYNRGHLALKEDKEHPVFAKDFLDGSPRRLYKFIPEHAYILNPPITVEGHIFDNRVEVSFPKD